MSVPDLDAGEGAAELRALDASFATVVTDAGGVVLRANDLFLRLFGYERRHLVGRSIAMLARSDGGPDDEAGRVWSDILRSEPAAVRRRVFHRSGSELWIDGRVTPLADAEGRVREVVIIATDVTQAQRRQAETLGEIAAISASHCVVTFDIHGTVIEANQHFLDATGYRLDEIEGGHHRMFVEPSHVHSYDYDRFWRELRQGRHQSGQYKRFGRDGRELWLQATYNPIADGSGRPAKIVQYATVVTDEKLRQADHQGQIAAIHRAQCVVTFALDGTILDANDNILAVLGYRLSEVRGRHHRIFVQPSEAEGAPYAAFWRQLAQGQFRAGEYKRIGKDGREVWLQATYNPIFDLNGRPFQVVKYATDVTLEKLRQVDYEGQVAAIRKSQGVMTLALDGTILDANENLLSALGYRLDEITGRPHSLLVEPAHAGTGEYARFWETLRSGAFVDGMHRRRGKDGRVVWLQATYNPIFDLNGLPSKIVKYATDVTSNVALAEAFDDAQRQAQHDSATALPNRIRLAAFMAAALARPGARIAVLCLDLDRFKLINDGFGHHVGDRVLGETADRLRRCLRNDQIVARVGGDEFVVAAPDLGDDAIESLCQRLIAAASAPIPYDGVELRIGTSIGIAVSPDDGTEPDELLRNADAALYRSKQDGRGIYRFFATEMNERVTAARALVDDMRRAIGGDEFFVEYQPRVDTRARSIQSVEALLRWAHPERGRLEPGDFLPLAERSGLILPLGAWVLRTACAAAAAWPGLGVSVNLSVAQFQDESLVETVAAALDAAGLSGDRLEIEVTEAALFGDTERALETLNELKRLGVRLAVDDFGAGYSPLNYLRRFPFDTIKIDRRFIADLETRADGRAIVQAVVGLGRALGIAVTAEGVETAGQLALLTLDRCPEVQGFLLARPMDAAKLSALLLRERAAGPAAPAEDRPASMAATA